MAKSRFTVDLDESVDAKLASLATLKGTTKAEMIRRAILTYSILSHHVTDKTKISITEVDTDKVIKDVIFY